MSPGTRFVDWLWNARKAPSEEIEGLRLAPLACASAESTLARAVVFVCRSRTKTSDVPFVSPATRFVAELANAT